jgi:hypothetical protein
MEHSKKESTENGCIAVLVRRANAAMRHALLSISGNTRFLGWPRSAELKAGMTVNVPLGADPVQSQPDQRDAKMKLSEPVG